MKMRPSHRAEHWALEMVVPVSMKTETASENDLVRRLKDAWLAGYQEGVLNATLPSQQPLEIR